MKFTSKVCTVEKSCQVRRVKAVQDLSIRLGHGAEDAITGKLSPSSGKEIACGTRTRSRVCVLLFALIGLLESQ